MNGFTKDQKITVYTRSGGHCEVMHIGCHLSAVHYHHRRPRGMGGHGLHSVANCLHVCRPCHERVHSMPNWSKENGFLVSQFADPAEVPVWWRCNETAGQREYVLLTEAGTKSKQLKREA